MGIYRELARNEGVFRILFSQLTARFPFGMLSIIVLLHMQQQFGEYTSAGVVLATQSIGQAISGPLSSRLMGKFGMRRVLWITSVFCTGFIIVIAFVHLPLAITALISFSIGLTTPPITPAVRTLYPRLVPGNQISALFSLDAAAQELIWVLGPVIAVFIAAQFGTAVGLTVAAAFMLGGGAWFILSRPVGVVKIPPSRGSLGAVLRAPDSRHCNNHRLLLVASFAAIEAGIVRAFAPAGDGGHSSIESGIVLAIFAAGSLVGGLFVGGRPLRPWSLAIRIGIVLAGTLACLVSLNIWWLSLVLFIGGLGTAPTFAGISSMIGSTIKFSETAEAFGWIGTGQLVGVATGSAVAGIAIDAMGAVGAIIVSSALITIAGLIAAFTTKWVPDLKGLDIEQPPETGTITLPLP